MGTVYGSKTFNKFQTFEGSQHLRVKGDKG